jgi:hypothetical protein
VHYCHLSCSVHNNGALSLQVSKVVSSLDRSVRDTQREVGNRSHAHRATLPFCDHESWLTMASPYSWCACLLCLSQLTATDERLVVLEAQRQAAASAEAENEVVVLDLRQQQAHLTMELSAALANKYKLLLATSR